MALSLALSLCCSPPRPQAASSHADCDKRRRPRKLAATRSTTAGAAAAAAAAAGRGVDAPLQQQLLALKEWAPACAAIADGEQTVLLRKGGIREPVFAPAARRFLLFPTSFHSDSQLLKPAAAARYAPELKLEPRALPRLRLATWACVSGAWTTHDPAVLQRLDELHIYQPEFLEARLRWRERQPITVLELRAFRLAAPLEIAPQEDFWGCFSWVPLGAEAAAAAAAAVPGAAPAQGDDAFAARQALCRRQLALLDDAEELVF